MITLCLYNLCGYFPIPLLNFQLGRLFPNMFRVYNGSHSPNWWKEILTSFVCRGETLLKGNLVLSFTSRGGDPSTV